MPHDSFKETSIHIHKKTKFVIKISSSYRITVQQHAIYSVHITLLPTITKLVISSW